MKILLTSSSFYQTPGDHKDLLANQNFKVDYIEGPVKESVLLPIISQYDGIICGDDEITRNVIEKGKKGKLKVISKYGIGLDKVDLNAAKEFNLPVTNCPGVNHIAVAEHILSLMFCFFKNIHHEYNYTIAGKWKRLIGHEIFGKKIGILGLGRIGKELAKRCKALEMEVYVCDLNCDLEFCKSYSLNICESINDLLKNIDILALTLPLNSATKGLIDYNLIKNNSKNLTIINTSRGEIIDLKSLVRLLQEKINAYLTDVLEIEPMKKNHPLLNFENVLITPHIGSRTYETVQRQGLMAINNLLKYIN